MRQEDAGPPAQDQVFMLRGRSGLSEAQVQLGHRHERCHCASSQGCTSRTGRRRRPTPRTPASGRALAAAAPEQAAGAAALAGAHRPGGRRQRPTRRAPWTDEGSSEAIGSDADGEDGDELERALGRSLDVLAAEASQSGCDSLDEAVVDHYEQTAEQLAEAMMAMREARQQLQAVRKARKGQGPPRRGAGAAGKGSRRRRRVAPGAHRKSGDAARAASTALGWR